MHNHAWVTDVLEDLRAYLELNDQPNVMAAVAVAGQIAETEFGGTQNATAETISLEPADPRLRLVRQG
jgi:hypothetical protein